MTRKLGAGLLGLALLALLTAAANAARAPSVVGSRSPGSRPPQINCSTWAVNSISRMPPRPRLRSKPGPNAWPCA